MLYFKAKKNLETKLNIMLDEKDSRASHPFKYLFSKRSNIDSTIVNKQNLSLSDNIVNEIRKEDYKVECQKTYRVVREVLVENLNQIQQIRNKKTAFIPKILSKKHYSCQNSRNNKKNSQNIPFQKNPFLPCINISQAKQFIKLYAKSNLNSYYNENQMKIHEKRSKSVQRENLLIIEIENNLQNSTILLDGLK